MDIKRKASEYKISELMVKDFFNSEFVKLLEEKFDNIKFEHACFNLIGIKEGEEKESVVGRLIIGHDNSKEEKNKIVTVGASTAENCESLMDVIENYIKENNTD